MKIAYRHLVQHIEESPSIEHISNKLFQLGHEHEIDGDILDMEFTPNRGDCLSINGLLRDLAAFYTVDLHQEVCTEKLNELQLDFENLSESTCPKISFLKLEIDQVPSTYKNSLGNYFSDLGLNRCNFFTDVANYLSYETGQPTHCYDANTINNKLVFHEIKNNEVETNYVSRILSKIIAFAEDYNVHVFLVAHPTKGVTINGVDRVATLNDISGSGNFFNKTHNGISVFREKDINKNPDNLVEVHVQKVKFKFVGTLGSCKLEYDLRTGNYFDTDKDYPHNNN